MPDIVDLRSDTVTRPSPAMRQAMAEAEVGDDVLGDDPTVLRLQEYVADLLGQEAALYTPSGVMANQIAIRAHTEAGDLIITNADSHIYRYESGAPAALSGCTLALLPGERGLLTADQVEQAVLPSNDHFPRTRLIVLENTHNRGGGSVWPVEQIAAIRDVADRHQLRMHLDGARLMNACAASSRKPTDYTKYFDTVSICFSKGLGAPVGSAVAGTADTIERAHRFRKMFGGGMRQVGIIAAGALYAIQNNVERLVDDHARAKRLSAALAEMNNVAINVEHTETNLVYFTVAPALGTAAELCEKLNQHGVWMLAESRQRVRAVTHMDVDDAGIERAIAVLRQVTEKVK